MKKGTSLQELFLQHLQLQGIAEFTSLEAMEWYNYYYTGHTVPRYSDLSYLVLRPLRDKGLIKWISRGHWEVLLKTKRKSKATSKAELQKEGKEEEFFKYIESKMQGG